LEELKHIAHEEELSDLGHETDTEDQVSNFLRCYLILLNDPNVGSKLTHMLYTCMWKELMSNTILATLPERELFQVRKKKCTGRKFKLTVELCDYDMEGVMLDLGSNVNILLKKS
jgi:hypothetical protein